MPRPNWLDMVPDAQCQTGIDAPHTLVRGDARDTSVAASIDAFAKSGTARRRVYDCICEQGEYGATDEEVQVMLRMNPNTQRPRRVELENGGWVKDAGIRRPCSSGSMAAVWVKQ